MKVVMLSNFYNAHQHSLASTFYYLLGKNYIFIQTMSMLDEQKNLGYTTFDDLPYIQSMYKDKKSKEICQQEIENADILISGGYNDFVYRRIKQNKITFVYIERLFVKSILPALKPKRLLEYFKRTSSFNNSNTTYILCSSAYLPYDLKRIGFQHKNMLKFGYFPYTDYEIKKPKANQTINIIWCGRMIDWKQGEHVIYMAKKLKDLKLMFTIDMIGNGDMKENYVRLIKDLDVSDVVTLYSPIQQKDMLQRLANSDIVIQSSNYKEGWGAVVNEAMSVGTCVVASSAMGSVPYLIDHGKNGFSFKHDDIGELTSIVQHLIQHPQKITTVGANAKQTISTLWNGKLAADRLVQIFHDVLKEKEIQYFDEGPLSFAPIIKNIN